MSYYILKQTIRQRKPDYAMSELKFWNNILAFADETLIMTENLFDLRKAINCLELEIKKVGV